MSSFIGNKELIKVFVGNKETTNIFLGSSEIYSSGPNADPVLNNNDWATIRAVCEAGKAANYWAVGDVKEDIGADGKTRHFQIVDMQGLYNKHVVFLQVETEPSGYVWDSNNVNNYSTSKMRATHLPAILLKYSSALQENLTNTTYKVAQNGTSSTILDLTDKLFLPAAKELFGSGVSYSRSEEIAALSQYQYYATNTAASYKQKTKIGESSPSAWWERSPSSGSTDSVCFVLSSGNAYTRTAYDSSGVAPAFSF